MNSIEEKNPYLALILSGVKIELTIDIPKIFFSIKEGTEVLYIEGIFECFESIRGFLKGGGVVVFVERDLKKIAAFLQSTDINDQERIEVILPEEAQYARIAWKYLFLKSQYIGVLSRLIEVNDTVHMIASDYQDGGKTVLKNIQLNLLRTKEFTDGRSLKGSCKGKPIVVCGSGGSLIQSLERLKSIQENVIILATGSSIPILIEANIRIDFGAFIDPDPPLEKYRELKSFGFPLFYQNRISEVFFQLHQGEKIWMGETGGWPLEDWISQEIGLFHFRFDSGWTVGCFGVHIAAFLGGSPIILLGLDSSIDEIRSLENGEFMKDGRITRKDLYGGLQWLEKFIAEQKESTFIQGFEHLQIPGCQLNLEWDKDLSSISLPVFPIKKEVFSIDGYLVQKAIAKIHGVNFSKELEDFLITLSKGVDKKGFDLAYAKLEFFVSGEPFYEYLVSPLWEMFQEVYLRNIPKNCPLEVQKALAKVSFFQMLCRQAFLPDTILFEDAFSRTIYVNGKVEGEVVRFYENGNIASREYYAASKPIGKWEMFYETGEPKSIVEFKKGKLDGQFDLFYKIGKKRSGFFCEGKKEGIHKIYTLQGNLLFNAFFHQNSPVGTANRYSYQGELLEEITYLEDLRFNRKEYSNDGKIKYEGVFNEDLFIENRFYENGEVEKREGVWKEGKIIWN